MKLLRLNHNTWVNPKLISMVTVDSSEGGGRCSVYSQGAGAVLDTEYADVKLLKIIHNLLPKPKK